ncbi:MAG: hypothetical protein ACE5GG_03530 [Candidatus Omnitrophota bacterium]
MIILTALLATYFSTSSFSLDNDIEKNIKSYFDALFKKLGSVAEQDPTSENFRQIMRRSAQEIEGLYGATLIDADFVIRQVYYPSHFLARGFDLKKVKELKDFYRMMQDNPRPQLSEPGHGNIFQPGLIAMRYPVIKNGKLKNIVSIMVRTKTFLKTVSLDKCRAFQIICRGKLAEQKGRLSRDHKEITLNLPSTQWTIRYDP